jgi:hypothetical protein
MPRITRAQLLKIDTAYQLKPILDGANIGIGPGDLDTQYDSRINAANGYFQAGQVALALFVNYLIDAAEAYPPDFYVSSWAAYVCVQGQYLAGMFGTVVLVLLIAFEQQQKSFLAEYVTVGEAASLQEVALQNRIIVDEYFKQFKWLPQFNNFATILIMSVWVLATSVKFASKKWGSLDFTVPFIIVGIMMAMLLTIFVQLDRNTQSLVQKQRRESVHAQASHERSLKPFHGRSAI